MIDCGESPHDRSRISQLDALAERSSCRANYRTRIETMFCKRSFPGCRVSNMVSDRRCYSHSLSHGFGGQSFLT